MLQVNNITFGYSKEKTTLKNINFSLQKGEHLCIMGASGCGKSTLLKALYGLLDLKSGTIFYDDFQVLGPEYYLVPGVDFFKYVAQDFDLISFTSVSENIKKFLSRFDPEEAQRRTNELLNIIEMTDFANTKVENLSGGQKQRVAIAKALAKQPKLLLLDEPFSQIDNFKKNSLRRNLFNYLKKNKITCITATHQGTDALSFANHVIILKNGEIIANDKPEHLYKNPKIKYVASLFDTVNEIIIDQKQVEESILLYPHQIEVVANSARKAVVKEIYFKGSHWLIKVIYNSRFVFLKHPTKLKIDEIVSLKFDV
ncbi:ABC transporter ATP-binding protein [Tenacibaculum dicentrarchi]|nr:ABC transporter ATP-binding protein [Tenacibaculum dicentrarchi]